MLIKEWSIGNFFGFENEKGAVGCNFVKADDVPELETEAELEQLNILQFDANRLKDEGNKYDAAVVELSQREKRLIELRKEEEKYRREKSRLKKGYPALMAAWIGFGAYLGLISAIDAVLSWHGPTTTLFGTTLATIFYVASTALFAFVCGWTGKNTSQILYDYMAEQVIVCEDEIASVQEEMEELRHRASRLAERAWSNQL